MSVIIKGGGNNVLADVDSVGNMMVTLEGQKVTYRVSSGNGGAGSLGIASLLIGSSTKKVKLIRIEFNCNAAASALVQVAINKYSTTPSGGTSTTIAGVPNDSSDAAASAVYKSYTVNPTAGTLVGPMGTWVVAAPINSTAAFSNPVNVINFSGGAGEKPITLNNANECIGITLSQAVFLNITLVWTEE